VIQDHDGIIRPLERGQQEVGGFGRGAVVCGHRGLDLNGGALFIFYRFNRVQTVVLPHTYGRKSIIVKNS
jgi:hypothetical protein